MTYRFFAIAVLAMTLPTATLATGVGMMPSQNVQVTNFPDVQDVFVTNPPTPPGSFCNERFQLVGFTSTQYKGNLGGNFGATRKCQLEFAGSRMCTLEEAVATTNLPTLPTLGAARIHSAASGSFGAGVLLSADVESNHFSNCASWLTDNSSGRSRMVTIDGTAAGATCNIETSIACCAPVQ